MKKTLAGLFVVTGFLLIFYLNSLFGRENPPDFPGHPVPLPFPEITEIAGVVKKGETLSDIFKRHELDMQTLYKLTKASKEVYNLIRVRPNRSYVINTLRMDGAERGEVKNFRYSIDDSHYLKVIKGPDGYTAEKVKVDYERRRSLISGTIRDNLINSIGNDREHLRIAFDLAEIFESSIDFVTELREGDRYRLLVEELWLNGVFKGYGKILAAEFVNNGKTYEAYRFDVDGRAGYYDGSGRSLKKALMRAPLRFRYISSGFTYRRKHPILKTYRAHRGIDYAAPRGTPVSAAGNGTVKFAGWRGGYGKLVIIKHPNGYETYYGHLSRIKRGIRRGKKVSQGDIIAYVGSTGLSTGPHLHYSIKRYGKFLNPLKIKLPRNRTVPDKILPAFRARVDSLRAELKQGDGRERIALR
ncbi:MAG: peptidoglycan DD-metalloendopeptidase family protein [Nitrospirae bacterium]|nr:peptidoglycan DD-metalloendopeptidase family protein [Nitrospirota bacterium]